MVEFYDADIGINKLIHLNSKYEQDRYNELINEIKRYKADNDNNEAAINRLYARYYGNVCDKAYGKRYINMWNMKMRLLKQMYGELIRLH